MKHFISNLVLIMLFLFSVSLFVSCNLVESPTEEEEEPTPKEINVYVVGYMDVIESIGNTISRDAKCWKNGESILFSRGIDSENTMANSVFVSGNDVYIVGAEGKKLVYWKNNEKVYLTDGKYYAMPISIFVDNQDVYILGQVQIGNELVATYWKNGIQVFLPESVKNYDQIKLVVSNGDVYITMIGYKDNTSFGLYMKNKEIIEIPNSFSVRDIQINGLDVYLVGETLSADKQKTLAAYWKNGALTILGNNEGLESYATDIEISGDDVIILGGEKTINTSTIVYWKNGLKTTLTDINKKNYPSGLSLCRGDIYISGTEYGPLNKNGYDYILAKYWKNNEVHILSDSIYRGHTTDIFVAEN